MVKLVPGQGLITVFRVNTGGYPLMVICGAVITHNTSCPGHQHRAVLIDKITPRPIGAERTGERVSPHFLVCGSEGEIQHPAQSERHSHITNISLHVGVVNITGDMIDDLAAVIDLLKFIEFSTKIHDLWSIVL